MMRPGIEPRTKKENLQNWGLHCPGKPQSEIKKCEKRDKYFNHYGIEKAVEQENDDNTNCNWCSCYSHQRVSTRAGGVGNKRTSGDHPNYCIIEIG